MLNLIAEGVLGSGPSPSSCAAYSTGIDVQDVGLDLTGTDEEESHDRCLLLLLTHRQMPTTAPANSSAKLPLTKIHFTKVNIGASASITAV